MCSCSTHSYIKTQSHPYCSLLTGRIYLQKIQTLLTCAKAQEKYTMLPDRFSVGFIWLGTPYWGSVERHIHRLHTVLKYSTPELANFSAISFVVTTADTGWPLPIGLPSVTISGHTPTQQRWGAFNHTHLPICTFIRKDLPCDWKLQKCLPLRPNPTWISSAMHRPPAARIWLWENAGWPSQVWFHLTTKYSHAFHVISLCMRMSSLHSNISSLS